MLRKPIGGTKERFCYKLLGNRRSAATGGSLERAWKKSRRGKYLISVAKYWAKVNQEWEAGTSARVLRTVELTAEGGELGRKVKKGGRQISHGLRTVNRWFYGRSNVPSY